MADFASPRRDHFAGVDGAIEASFPCSCGASGNASGEDALKRHTSDLRLPRLSSLDFVSINLPAPAAHLTRPRRDHLVKTSRYLSAEKPRRNLHQSN